MQIIYIKKFMKETSGLEKRKEDLNLKTKITNRRF